MAADQPGVYPFSLAITDQGTTEQEKALQKAVVAYGNALSQDLSSNAARWEVGRAWLARGDLSRARGVLLPLIPLAGSNPLLQLDLLTVLAQSGTTQELLQVYEQSPPPYTRLKRTVREAIALDYLQQADMALADGDETEFIAVLQRVLEVRPGDLFANYHLKLKAETHGEYSDAEAYLRMLEDYQHEGIDSTDDRLLSYVASVIPQLLAERIWSTYELEYVLAFVVYSHTDSLATEQLLRNLVTSLPDDPEWVAYLGNLYAQRHERDQALSIYQSLVLSHPEFDRAYFRLGQIQEQACGVYRVQEESGCLDQAYEWYVIYHTRVPDDLMGIRKLADFCELRNCADSHWLVDLVDRLAKQEPQYLLNPDRNRLGSGWTLLGYDVDEERLVRGEPTAIWLYWLPSADYEGVPSSGGTWYHAGNRWIQVIEYARSLVANGGFELGLNGVDPAGFLTAYSQPSICQDWRNGKLTRVALLQTSDAVSSGRYQSSDISISPSTLYLQSGWIKSTGPGAYLGTYCLGSSVDDVAPYNYAALGVLSPEWQHFAGLTGPLPGSISWRMHLLNTAPRSRVYFDNVFLVAIGKPGL